MTIEIHYVWTRGFFLEKGGKITVFQKYPDTCGQGLTLSVTDV